MVKHNIRVFAYCIIGLSFLTYLVISFFTQDIDQIDWYKALINVSTTITLNILFWIIFIGYLWKLPIFRTWLVQVSNLNGKWVGEIYSNSDKSDGKPIPIEIYIDQNFFNCQVQLKTNESNSYSITASFNIDKERGFNQLMYTYLNTPNASVRDKSPIHYGTTLLNYDKNKPNELEGDYWTSRESTGTIKLTKSNDA